MGVGDMCKCMRVRVHVSTPDPACCVWLPVHRSLPVKHSSTTAPEVYYKQVGQGMKHNRKTKILRRNSGRPRIKILLAQINIIKKREPDFEIKTAMGWLMIHHQRWVMHSISYVEIQMAELNTVYKGIKVSISGDAWESVTNHLIPNCSRKIVVSSPVHGHTRNTINAIFLKQLTNSQETEETNIFLYCQQTDLYIIRGLESVLSCLMQCNPA